MLPAMTAGSIALAKRAKNAAVPVPADTRGQEKEATLRAPGAADSLTSRER
jgi:hypothetical protein